jgi:hypothetical protein
MRRLEKEGTESITSGRRTLQVEDCKLQIAD